MNSIWFKSNWQIAILVVFQVILSLFYIDAHSIDLDEPFSIFYSQFDLSELWKLFENENNPPLHFLLLHGWIKLFGTDPLAVRSLSLLFGLATTPIIYAISKQLSGHLAGILSVLFFIFSNFHFYHNLEARAYPIFVFLFSLLLWLIIKLHSTYSNTIYAAIGVLYGALFYTHYIAPILLSVIGVYLLIYTIRISDVKTKKQHFKGLFFIALPLFIFLSLPLLNIFYMRLSHVTDGGTWVPAAQWSELYGLLNKFMNGREVVFIILIWLLLLLVFNAKQVVQYFKDLFNHPSKRFIFLVFLFCYVVTFSISKLTNVQLFLDRYMYFLSVPLFLLLADFASTFFKQVTWFALIPIIAFITFFKPNEGNNRETNAIAKSLLSKNGSIFISPPTFDLTFLYHFNRSLFESKVHGHQLFKHGIYPIYTLAELTENDTLQFPLYYIDADSYFIFKHHDLKDELSSKYRLTDSISFKGNYVLYTFSDDQIARD